MRLTMAERLARRCLNYVVGYNEFFLFPTAGKFCAGTI